MNIFEGLFLFPFYIICSFLIFIALFLPFLTFYSISHVLSLYTVLFVSLLKIVMDCYGQLDLVDNLI